jgi:hypothetical protein
MSATPLAFPLTLMRFAPTTSYAIKDAAGTPIAYLATFDEGATQALVDMANAVQGLTEALLAAKKKLFELNGYIMMKNPPDNWEETGEEIITSDVLATIRAALAKLQRGA